MAKEITSIPTDELTKIIREQKVLNELCNRIEKYQQCLLEIYTSDDEDIPTWILQNIGDTLNLTK